MLLIRHSPPPWRWRRVCLSAKGFVCVCVSCVALCCVVLCCGCLRRPMPSHVERTTSEAINRNYNKLARLSSCSPIPPQVLRRGRLGVPWLVLVLVSRRVCKRKQSSALLGVGRAFARRAMSQICSAGCRRPCIFSARTGCKVSPQYRRCKSARCLRKSIDANSPRRLGVFRGCKSGPAVRLVHQPFRARML